MQTICIDEIKKYLIENLSEEKYLHSLGTAEASRQIALKVGYDSEKAFLAGLLHDCAKSVCCSDILCMCENAGICLEEGEVDNPKVLHAPAGCVVAVEKFKIEDNEILDAIRWHTLGRVEMSMLEKIVFLADKIEPETRGREEYELRLKNLDQPMGLEKEILACYSYTIKSLVDRNLKICSKTVDVYNYLLNLTK